MYITSGYFIVHIIPLSNIPWNLRPVPSDISGIVGWCFMFLFLFSGSKMPFWVFLIESEFYRWEPQCARFLDCKSRVPLHPFTFWSCLTWSYGKFKGVVALQKPQQYFHMHVFEMLWIDWAFGIDKLSLQPVTFHHIILVHNMYVQEIIIFIQQ